MDKMREEFEKWALAKGWSLGRDGDVYRNTYVGVAFEAWQASNELITKTVSNLKEIADDYGLIFHASENGQVIMFIKQETGLCDPAFTLVIEYNVKQVSIINLGKTVELYQLESYVRLLCEIIA